MMRILVLCTHNSARSQMAEAWLRHYASELDLDAKICSAGNEKTFVKPDAIRVMKEVDIDISEHTSKTIYELPDLWNFDVLMTVCDSANEACPVYPAKTTRLHVSFPDPSGQGLERWREVRDAMAITCLNLVTMLKAGELPFEAQLQPKGLS
ncbi:MAG: arsenate reductase ArsC [Trueperaceae bacterium]|nr:arsenate reductase ArsC [Trueperaceae bacterium]